MAVKFKRPNVTEKQKLRDLYSNTFNEGGFIYDEIYETKDRDITSAYLGMLSNTYNMGVYNSILLGYKKVPYSEAIIQEEEFGKLTEKDIKKLGSTVFALTKPLWYTIYQCVWIKSPVTIGKIDENFKPRKKDKKKDKKKVVVSTNYKLVQPKKAAEIINTLNLIKDELRGDFHIVPEVEEFLKTQLKKQDLSNIKDLKTNKSDLFIRSTKTEEIIKSYIFIPLLKDNMYYEDQAGNKRYPYLSECYHYHKTRAEQIKFHVKEIKKNNCVLVDSYFTVGKPKKFDREIFVIKQYGIFYNPFMFLEQPVAERLYKRLKNNPKLSIETLGTLEDTFRHYMDNIEIVEEFGNAIPPVDITESSVKSLKINTSDELLNSLAVNGEDPVDLEADFDGEFLIEDPIEEETRDRAIKHSKGYTTIDDKTIESVVMGHNGERCFGFYDHIIEYYIRVFVATGGGKKGRTVNLDTKDIPRPLQLVATINQNSDLFMTNNQTHPLDAFVALAYKKYLYFTPKENSKSTDYVNPQERYRSYDEEYGKIDPITVKSEETCGLVASLIPYKQNAHMFVLRSKGDK